MSEDQLAAFCRRWKIQELALFGSVLREDFRPESDIDVLVTFAPILTWMSVKMTTKIEYQYRPLGDSGWVVSAGTADHSFRIRLRDGNIGLGNIGPVNMGPVRLPHHLGPESLPDELDRSIAA